MASFWFNPGVQDIFEGVLDLSVAEDFRMLLIDDTATYTPARTTTFIDTGGANDIVDDELVVGGYARVALTTEAVDISGNLIRFNADNVAFGALSGGATVAAAVIYDHTGTDTTSVPIIFSDFTDTATNGSTFTVNQPANGWGHGDTT